MSSKKNTLLGNTFAVIETGSKQYKVVTGDKIKIEKLEAVVGDKVNFDKVLLISKDNEINVGTPLVKGSKVIAEVVAQGKNDKVSLFKYKPKERQRVFKGHRQPYT